MARPRKPKPTVTAAEEVEVATVELTTSYEKPTEDDVGETPTKDTNDEEVSVEVIETEPEVSEEPAVKIITLPEAKKVAGDKPKITPVNPKVRDRSNINNITIEELVRRKHNYDLANSSSDLQSVIDFLDRYEEAMKPDKGITDSAGESLQRQMFKIYLRILSLNSNREMAVAMEILLWKMYKNTNESFGRAQMSRFTRHGKWVIQELNMYLQLTHVLQSIKNPSTRTADLKKFNIPAIISTFPADKATYTESLINWVSNLR